MSNAAEKPTSRASARNADKPASKAAADKPASKAKAASPEAAPAKAKTAKRNTSAASRGEQPTYLAMIQDAIVQSGEGAEGLSRQGIKRHLQDVYGVFDDNAANSRISAAIKKGTLNGSLELPRGASGRVRLSAIDKENTPAPKTGTARVKAMEKAHKKAEVEAAKSKARRTKAAAKPAPKAKTAAAAPAKKPAPAAATKKTTSSTTKKATGRATKAEPAKKAPAAATKKAPAKKTAKPEPKQPRAPPRDRNKPVRSARGARKST